MKRKPPNKESRIQGSKKSKSQKLRILAKHMGIREYAELAKIVEQSKKAKNIREGITSRAHTHQKMGTIEPLLKQKRNERLNVTKYMESEFRGLSRKQPKWKLFSEGWNLFYKHVLPKIQHDVTRQPLLRTALLERKILQQINSTNKENGPISVGDVRHCLAWAKRMHARRLFAIKALKKEMIAGEYYRQETNIKRKMANTRELYAMLNNFNANQGLNARQLDYIPVGVIIEEALRGNDDLLEGLIGTEETKQMTAAEYTARQTMKTWSTTWH